MLRLNAWRSVCSFFSITLISNQSPLFIIIGLFVVPPWEYLLRLFYIILTSSQSFPGLFGGVLFEGIWGYLGVLSRLIVYPFLPICQVYEKTGSR